MVGKINGLFIASGVWGSGGALGELDLFQALASQGDTGSSDCCRAHVRMGLAFADHVPDAAEGGQCILVNGGPHVRTGWVLSTGSLFHDHDDPFAMSQGSQNLEVNQPQGIMGLQIIGSGAIIHLLISL